MLPELKILVSFLLILIFSLAFVKNSAAQSDSLNLPFKSATVTIKDPVSSIKFGGYFRFFGYVRDLPTIYPLAIPSYYYGPYPQQTTISIGTGYREPMMLLSISGTAKKNITFGTDLMINSAFNGDFASSSIALNLGTNFYSTLVSNFGKFKVHAGGISWYKQSKLTVWAEEGYLRYSLFERAPYDPLNKTATDRYEKYYEQGTIDQDIRFSNVAFQGVTISGDAFPWYFADDISFQGILGKTQNNIDNIVNKKISFGKDDYCFGGRLIKKTAQNNSFAINYFKSEKTTDSTSYLKRSYDIASLEFDYTILGLHFFGEIGAGSYESAEVEKSSGEAVVINLATPKKYTLIPLQIQYSRIAPEAVNVNSSFINSSVSDLVQTTVIEEGANPTVMSGFGGPITNLGYLSNNRQGFSLNTDFEIRDFSISCGFGFYSELERTNTKFAYNHITSGLILSRISYFSTGYGPYGHLNSFYRGVYENVAVTDDLLVDSIFNFNEADSTTTLIKVVPLFDKFYCSSDLHLKYKTLLFKRDLYLFSLTNFNTAQDFFSFFPVTTEEAFIRQFNHQFDLCYSLSKRVSLVLKHGLERVIASSSTELDTEDPFPIGDYPGLPPGSDLGIENYTPSLLPRNQIGLLYGFGFDIKIRDGAFLFLRHTQFKFNDKNFAETNIKGSETTLELKINF